MIKITVIFHDGKTHIIYADHFLFAKEELVNGPIAAILIECADIDLESEDL